MRLPSRFSLAGNSQLCYNQGTVLGLVSSIAPLRPMGFDARQDQGRMIETCNVKKGVEKHG